MLVGREMTMSAYSHSIKRAKERYNLELNGFDLGVIRELITLGHAVLMSRGENGKNIYLKLTGTMAGNNSLIIPASTTGGTATRLYVIQDATDRTTANKYTLSIKTAGSSSPIAVPVGSTMLIHSNGTDARLDILQKGNFAITSSSITAYTAVAGDNLLIDTQAAQVTITLPASPTIGDEVSFMDVSPSGGFATNKVTINRNSQPIRGAASNLELVTNNQSIKLRYTNATKGWQYVYNVTS